MQIYVNELYSFLLQVYIRLIFRVYHFLIKVVDLWGSVELECKWWFWRYFGQTCYNLCFCKMLLVKKTVLCFVFAVLVVILFFLGVL